MSGGVVKDAFKDLSSDSVLASLAGTYVRAAAAKRAAEKEEKETKLAIMARLQGTRWAKLRGFVLVVKSVAGSPDRTITVEMVGQVLKGRSGYELLEITPTTVVANKNARARAVTIANDDRPKRKAR